MKQFLISFFLIFYLMVAVVTVSAQTISIDNPLVSGDIPTLIDKIASWLLGIGTVLATIVILWAAFLFMTSGGSKDKVTQARQTLWYAVIGLTVLLLAKGATLLIQNTLSGRF
ncbi:MAG: TrbC/VirB2 family protein [Candidatus Azambacteria bacterium]|nr:TrbC/VirB2 family protein [Candidatus Azambacteria bacterium]